jgi:hypothetical protein
MGRAVVVLGAGLLVPAGCGGEDRVGAASALPVGDGVILGPVSFGAGGFFLLNADGSKGTSQAPAVAGADGRFDWFLLRPSSTGCLLLEVDSGLYVDSVGGGVSDLDPNVLQAVLCGTPEHVAVTPLTTMAAARALALLRGGAPLEQAVRSANVGVAQQYGLRDIGGVLPVDATSAMSVRSGTREQRDYGVVVAGVSELAGTLGVKPADLTTALADDLVDGILDGKNAGTTIQVRTRTGGSVALAPSVGTTDLQAGITRFTASAKNQSMVTERPMVTTALTIGTASASVLQLTSAAVPAFYQGRSGTGAVSVTGGTPPYRWTISAGALPAGFALNAMTGAITGVGGTPGVSAPFTVTVTDSAMPPGSVSVVLTVLTLSPPPIITCTSPTGAMEGVPFSAQVATATGGVPPYYFMNGSFANPPPIGLSVDLNGKLTGTPAKGTGGRDSTFTACVVDLAGSQACCDRGLALKVAKPIAKPPSAPGLGCPSIYDGTYAGAYSYRYLDMSMPPMEVKGSISVSVTLECVVGAAGTVVLNVSSATVSHPAFGCTSACVPQMSSVASLPSSPEAPSMPGHGIILSFPNGSRLTTANAAGEMTASADGRTLSSHPSVANRAWTAILSGGMRFLFGMASSPVQTTSWTLSKR